MELVEKLLAYYKENEEDFIDDIEELDNWNGCLYDDRVRLMDDLDDVLQDIKPSDILLRAFFGYDKTREDPSPFNPNRQYFYFNGYGNLVSTDKIDYSAYLYSDFIQKIIDNRHNLYLSEGAQELIDDYEDENE